MCTNAKRRSRPPIFANVSANVPLCTSTRSAMPSTLACSRMTPTWSGGRGYSPGVRYGSNRLTDGRAVRANPAPGREPLERAKHHLHLPDPVHLARERDHHRGRAPVRATLDRVAGGRPRLPPDAQERLQPLPGHADLHAVALE